MWLDGTGWIFMPSLECGYLQTCYHVCVSLFLRPPALEADIVLLQDPKIVSHYSFSGCFQLFSSVRNDQVTTNLRLPLQAGQQFKPSSPPVHAYIGTLTRHTNDIVSQFQYDS